MSENTRIEEIQRRVQALYDIPLLNFTEENRQELVKLDKEAEDMGYERGDGGDIANIRYVKKQ